MVSKVVVLDSGPLGLVTQPKATPAAQACRRWLTDLSASAANVVIPEIIDYELRRELLRSKKIRGLRALDKLLENVDCLAITTSVMRRAAELWAECRQRGQPTAAAEAIDIDVILAAQALSLGEPNLVVATTNPRHLAQFVDAREWREITVEPDHAGE